MTTESSRKNRNGFIHLPLIPIVPFTGRGGVCWYVWFIGYKYWVLVPSLSCAEGGAITHQSTPTGHSTTSCDPPPPPGPRATRGFGSTSDSDPPAREQSISAMAKGRAERAAVQYLLVMSSICSCDDLRCSHIPIPASPKAAAFCLTTPCFLLALLYGSARTCRWWLRQGAAAPRRRAVDGRRRRSRRCPGAAPAEGRQEEAAASAGHGRNAPAAGGRVRPPGVPREVLALRRSVSHHQPPLFLSSPLPVGRVDESIHQ